MSQVISFSSISFLRSIITNAMERRIAFFVRVAAGWNSLWSYVELLATFNSSVSL